jgi:gamma-glutamyltranspeptidase / glutathione hydrolase
MVRDQDEARRFPAGCVASPHHLASAAGAHVLASGGNALDAAIAANLTLAVVMPFACGLGGDLFAMVWTEHAGLEAYNGSGRSPAAATLDTVRSAAGADSMPERGPLPVTVPGAPEAWFTLLRRFGTRSFGELAATPTRLALDGFPLSAFSAAAIRASAAEFAGSRVFDAWRSVYAGVEPGRRLRQPALAGTLRTLSVDGPDGYYRGPIARAIADAVQSHGGLLAVEDLEAHHGMWVDPIRTTYRGVEVAELPPNTQGVVALEALNVVEAAGALPPDGAARHHLMIQAVKASLSDRDSYVTDPDEMTISPLELASKAWAAKRFATIDPSRSSNPALPSRRGGDTVYLCAADSGGMLVSLIQSNFFGFGSGLTVPAWGINLHNRGESFSLDPSHANVVGPRKRTMHTLIPAMAFRDGSPWLVFGSMGGHAQAQIHVQLLTRIVDDGADLQHAIDAPRWAVDPLDWSVSMEPGFDAGTVEGLRSAGHRIAPAEGTEETIGWAQAIMVGTEGFAAGSDRRAEGSAYGW